MNISGRLVLLVFAAATGAFSADALAYGKAPRSFRRHE
jgi:hypothetical protein